jgi:pimeloyl-ACP methyl ester carboxylesterase
MLLCVGCSSISQPGDRGVIFVVPGVGGDGPSYAKMVQGLRDAGRHEQTRAVHWGAPAPLFMLNLQNDSIHRAAESDLAQQIRAYRAEHPSDLIIVIGHSAGCGVTLGALARLEPGCNIDSAILLAASVSPEYNLAPALGHVRGQVHSFYSDRDTLWLGWRCSTFGTYDNVKTKAAGNQGFTSVEKLPPDLQAKFEQHPYDPVWSALGNNGGHMDPLARKFAEKVIAPLLPG